jgi:hypothetical protein
MKLTNTNIPLIKDLEAPVISENSNVLVALANVQSLIKNRLQDFSEIQDFQMKMALAFGTEANFTNLQNDWQLGNIDLPIVEVLTLAELNGAYGAFSGLTGKIYIAQEILTSDALPLATRVLLDEYGHFIDNKFNSQDTVGDEGSLFSSLVQQEKITPEKLLQLKAENDAIVINIDAQSVQAEAAKISDDGGFEGSLQKNKLDTNGGGFANFRYEHFVIPDNFIIRYEGKNILETGFVGGNRTGNVQIPKGSSDQLEVIVATDDAGTAWNYTVETFSPGIGILNAYAYASVAAGSNQRSSITFPIILLEASTTIN